MSEFNPCEYPSFQNKDLNILDKTTVFQGFFRIERYTFSHRLFCGGWSKPVVREIFERGNAVVILPYNPQTDQVVLIEQFRAGAVAGPGSPWLLEAVAGMIDKDETAEQVATREAQEEAGLLIDELLPMLGYFSSPGGSTERIQVFLGRLTAPVQTGIFGLAEEQEDIRVHVFSREKAMQLLAEGRIDNAATVIALQWLALNLHRVQEQWGV
ncbi:ADP-ribose diphosphatase [Chromatiaceae bacterium AAb-1]|nr:ADP-ribose diphosphatase [Chromatiaceae bacterium AAb-1]